MPPAPHRPPDLKFAVFRGSDAIARGLLTAHQLRSRAWRRIRQNVYADARIETNHHLACRAVALVMPPGSVIAGPSAACMLGIDHAATFSDDVHVIAPTTVRYGAPRGVRVHVYDYHPDDVVSGGDVPYTTINRTAWDTAVWLSPIRSVPILDAMLNKGLLTVNDFPTIIGRHYRRRGSVLARTAFDMADAMATTPAESMLRVRLVLAQIPRPVLQHPLPLTPMFHAPLTLDVDMAWPDYQVAVEYTPNRLALLTAGGWLAIYAPPARANRDLPTVLKEVRQALQRRGWRPPDAW